MGFKFNAMRFVVVACFITALVVALVVTCPLMLGSWIFRWTQKIKWEYRLRRVL